MRRKRLADLDPDTIASLGVEALKPAPIDDPAMPYPLRRKSFERWMEKRDAWVARREAYALRKGWPGGEAARLREEEQAHPVPDAPFDPQWEMEHGDL